MEGVAHVEGGDELLAVVEDLLEDLLLRVGVDVGVGPLVLVARRRAEDQVAPQRLLHEDPLAVRARAREEDVVARVAARLLEEHVLAEPRLDVERVVTDHLGDLVGEAAGAVDDVPRADRLLLDDNAVHGLHRARAAHLHLGDAHLLLALDQRGELLPRPALARLGVAKVVAQPLGRLVTLLGEEPREEGARLLLLLRRHVLARLPVVDRHLEGAILAHRPPDRLDGAPDAHLDAVVRRVLGERDVVLVRDERARVGREERRRRVVRQVGLHRAELVALDDPQVLDAVGRAAREELLEVRLLVGAARDDERARQLVPEVQVLVERGEHLVALPAQRGADAPRLVVVARVHDPAVALRRALRDVVGRLDHQHRRRRLRQLARHRAADAARADHDDVVRAVLLRRRVPRHRARARLALAGHILARAAGDVELGLALLERLPVPADVDAALAVHLALRDLVVRHAQIGRPRCLDARKKIADLEGVRGGERGEEPEADEVLHGRFWLGIRRLVSCRRWSFRSDE